MSEPQELATLSVINVMASTNKESLKPALLFVPVQPHGGSAAAMSYRTIVKKHIAHQCSRNRHGSKAYIPTAKTGPGEMGKQLVRFKLKQGRRTPQKAKILAAKAKDSPDTIVNTAGIPTLLSQQYSHNHLHIHDPTSTHRRDPFTTFPIEADDEVRLLFRYYVRDLNNHSISKLPDRDFVSLALSDAACFHTLMATLLQVQRSQGRPAGACFWYHRGAAMAALNKHLSTSHVHISDAMFWTVSMLAYLESRMASFRSQTTGLHIAALVKFLELRDGLVSVELYSELLRLSIWCSINPPLTVPTSVAPTKECKLDFDCREEGFTPLPNGVFDDIRRLVCLRGTFGCDPLPPEEDRTRSFAYQRFVLRSLGHTSRPLSTPSAGSAAISLVVRSIQLAKILFLYTICPAMSVSGVYSQSIAVALRACLEASCRQSEDSVQWAPGVLCWVLFNAAVTEQPRALREWYIAMIAGLKSREDLLSFHGVEKLMRQVCWLEDPFGLACRAVWRDVLHRPYDK